MAAKYVINKTATGYTFALQATNGQNVGVSQVFKTLEAAQAGVESVRKVASTAGVEDQTAEEVNKLENPKFELYKDKKGEFRFRLLDTEGQNILVSEGYTTLKACQNGIASVAKNSVAETVLLPEEDAPKADESKEEKAPKAEKPAKKAKKEAKKEEAKKGFAKPTFKDLEVIIRPVITEKSMSLMQDENKVTLVVRPDANKTEIKLAFERIYQVTVTSVKVSNVKPKTTTRGTRYHGKISGYKKAVVTIAEGEAIDLFKE